MSFLVSNNRLIIIFGQEGVGKSTTVRALAPRIPWSARIDGADLAAVNPWSLDEARLHLLWQNVADLAANYWAAGFKNFVGASFLDNLQHYEAFRSHLELDAEIYLVQLCAAKPTRDQRRIDRPKITSSEWRDHVDFVCPEDETIATETGQYRFLRIDNDDLSVEDTLVVIHEWAPELFE